MKKILSILIAVAMTLSMLVVPASAETFAKEWEFEGSTMSFGANNSTATSVGGCLVQTIAKSNTWLLSPNNLSVDASTYKYLKVRVKNSTTAAGAFAYEAIGTNKSAFSGTFTSLGTIPNDGEFHEYIVDLSEHGTDWSGTISRFRLRLSAWTTSGTVEVDYIKLSDIGVPPTMEFSSLNDPSDVPIGSPVTLAANVEGGTPSSIEYFVNGKSVGKATTAPFTVEWTPTTTGSYIVKATGTFGTTKESTPDVFVNAYDSTIVENSAYY